MTYVIEVSKDGLVYRYKQKYVDNIVGRRPSVGKLAYLSKVGHTWCYTFKRAFARDNAMKRIKDAKSKYMESWEGITYTSYDVKETIPT